MSESLLWSILFAPAPSALVTRFVTQRRAMSGATGGGSPGGTVSEERRWVEFAQTTQTLSTQVQALAAAGGCLSEWEVWNEPFANSKASCKG